MVEFADLNNEFNELIKKKNIEIELMIENKNKNKKSKELFNDSNNNSNNSNDLIYDVKKILGKQKTHENNRKLKSKAYQNKLNDQLTDIINNIN